MPSLSRHPAVANYLTVELAALKAMTQDLAELFGLTLSGLCEKDELSGLFTLQLTDRSSY